jgi:hypothetical protein
MYQTRASRPLYGCEPPRRGGQGWLSGTLGCPGSLARLGSAGRGLAWGWCAGALLGHPAFRPGGQERGPPGPRISERPRPANGHGHRTLAAVDR